MTDRLHFSQGFIGILSSIGAAGWIIGGLLFRWRLNRLGRKALLQLSILGGVLSTLSYLLLSSSEASAVAISLVGGITSMIAAWSPP